MGQAPLKAAPTTAPSLLASQPGVTSSALPAPFLLHLPGIAGARAIDNHMTVGFSQGGFKGDVQIYDWTEQDGGLDALLANKRNHLEAKKIADLLTARFDKDPTAPIYLSCHSGGAGLAVWALEQLPDRVKIKSILMMSPALSPSYDLTAALRHVSGSLFVFSSLEDQLVLGLGCRTAGTIDGVHTDAAGRVGFKMPATGDATQYAKVVPMPYNPEWIRLGDRGDHIGAMNQRFARVVLAPLVLSGTIPPDTADKVAILAAQSLQATNRK
jgi:hypothetical protein